MFETIVPRAYAIAKCVTLLICCLQFGCAGIAERKAPAPTEATVEKLAKQLTQQADMAMQSGDYQTATFLYQEAITYADEERLWLRLGAAYEGLGSLAKALQAYSGAVRVAPDSAAAHERAGMIYVAHGDHDSASQSFTTALEKDSRRWRSLNGQGVVADLRGDYGDAQEAYERALANNPESTLLWNNLGYSYYLAGLLDAAGEAYDRALALDKTYEPAIANVGLLYARQGEYGQAVEVLTQVREAAVAYNDIGYVALLNESWGDAVRLLQKAIDLSPTYYDVANQNLAYVHKAQRVQVIPPSPVSSRPHQTLQGIGSTDHDSAPTSMPVEPIGTSTAVPTPNATPQDAETVREPIQETTNSASTSNRVNWNIIHPDTHQ